MSTSDLTGPAGLAAGPQPPTGFPGLSEATLSQLASEIFGRVGDPVPIAASVSPAITLPSGPPGFPGFDTPPQLVPPAPRGSAADVVAPASTPYELGVGGTRLGNPPHPGHPTVLDPGFVPDLRTATPVLPPRHAESQEPSAPQYYFVREQVLLKPGAGRPDSSHQIFDVATLRRDFPILSERVNGHSLIWLDNAATTQKPRAVIERLAYFYEHENSNIHRAAHELAARATDAYENARQTVRRFIGASRDEEVIFVRGTTEAINLVAQSWGRRNLREGDEIVITHLEHHANIVPWQMVARQTGAIIKVAPVDDRGNLLMEEFADLLGPRTKLVSATHVSNALGTVTPVEQIVELGHRVGARVLIDGAQSVPHLAVDVQRLGADFFVFSGHKIFGPTGIGVLHIAERVWDETPAWQGGGNMIEDVTLERAVYQGPPNKYEAGTGNIADAVGLGEALRYVEKVGIERIAAWEHDLLAYATPRLAAVPGVRLVGTADHKASVLSFVLAGREPLEVGKALNAEGIAVRAGHHCAQPILRRLGLEATVRPSFAFYNTLEEADALVEAVRNIATSSKRG